MKYLLLTICLFSVINVSAETFGNTSIESSEDYFLQLPQGAIALTKPTSNGTLTSISLYCERDSLDTEESALLDVAIYSDNAGTPGTLLAQSTAGVLPGAGSANWGWVTNSNITCAITADTQYWLVLKCQSADHMIYDRYAAASTMKTPTTSGSFPSSWTNANTYTMRLSVYATYTPSVATTPSKGSSQVIILE